MLAIVHFAVGAAIGIGVFGPFVSERWRPALMVASGIWAMGPDLSKFLDAFKPLHDSVWANVFWMHGLLDAFETGHANAEAFTALAILVSATAIVTYKA